jgi:hypothetical protein
MLQIKTSRFCGGLAKDSCALEQPIDTAEDDDVDECESNQSSNPICTPKGIDNEG